MLTWWEFRTPPPKKNIRPSPPQSFKRQLHSPPRPPASSSHKPPQPLSADQLSLATNLQTPPPCPPSRTYPSGPDPLRTPPPGPDLDPILTRKVDFRSVSGQNRVQIIRSGWRCSEGVRARGAGLPGMALWVPPATLDSRSFPLALFCLSRPLCWDHLSERHTRYFGHPQRPREHHTPSLSFQAWVPCSDT